MYDRAWISFCIRQVEGCLLHQIRLCALEKFDTLATVHPTVRLRSNNRRRMSRSPQNQSRGAAGRPRRPSHPCSTLKRTTIAGDHPPIDRVTIPGRFPKLKGPREDFVLLVPAVFRVIHGSQCEQRHDDQQNAARNRVRVRTAQRLRGHRFIAIPQSSHDEAGIYDPPKVLHDIAM